MSSTRLLAALAILPMTPPAAAAAMGNAAAEIAALGGVMPASFEIQAEDPCAGTWNVLWADGQVAVHVIVYRYKGLRIANTTVLNGRPSNRSYARLDPYALATSLGGPAKLEMRCVRDRGVAKLNFQANTAPVALRAMRSADQAPQRTPSGSSGARVSRRASVREEGGNIIYVAADGTTRRVTDEGHYSDPVLAPDGRTIAFVHLDGAPTSEGDPGFTSLWLADTTTFQLRRLVPSRPNEEPKRNLAAFYNPRFSLDGGFVYVDAAAWATSSAVHQVNVATGAERFVVDGQTTAIIRTGPYRGHLIVGQHRYRKAPEGGSYNPLYVVRPDGTEVMMVPGSDADDYDAEALQAAWLRTRGWEAW